MDYQKRARELKRAGFIDYDLRKTLNQGQKAAITKIWNKTSAVITNADNFESRHVAKAAADKMRRDGYTVNKKGRVFVQKEGYQDVHIKSRKQKGGGREVVITRSIGRKKSVTKVMTGTEVLNALEKFDEKKLKKNQVVTVRIGDNAAFAIAHKGKQSLMNYINNKFTPKDPGTDKAYLISQMSIVTIEGDRPQSHGRVKKVKSHNPKKHG